MATFLAIRPASGPIRSQAGATPPSQHWFGALLAGGLTLGVMAVHGYHPYAEDGGLYLAGVKRLLDPGLYPQNAEFVLAPMRHSLFAPTVASIVRGLAALTGSQPMQALPWAIFALYLASVWTTLFAAWLLTTRCWSCRTAQAGAVALLACWLDLPVAGTALLWMDPYLTARSFSTPCMVLSLVGALDATDWSRTMAARRRGLAVWMGALGVATVVHPLMAGYALAATLLLGCLRLPLRANRRWAATMSLCLASVVLAGLLQGVVPLETPDYARAALTRSYWFLACWRWYELAGLLFPVAIAAAGARAIPQARTGFSSSRRALMQMAAAAGLTAATVALLFARAGAATHLVARLQPLRMFQVVYLAMILAVGAWLGEAVLRRSIWRWAAAAAVLAGAMAWYARTTYPMTPQIEAPWTASRLGPQSPWVQAFLWIGANTPRDALFALDADYTSLPAEDAQSFRAIAERSALADAAKDGGEASIAPQIAQAWAIQSTAQQGLRAQSDEQRVRRLAPLGASWMVLPASATTGFDCPYRNRIAMVCRIGTR